MKSKVSTAEKSFGSQASNPWWMSKDMQAMPSSSQTSRQVPMPAIGSQIKRRPEIQQQILDEVAAAVAGPAAVAVLTGPVEMVEAGQVWDGTGVSWC